MKDRSQLINVGQLCSIFVFLRVLCGDPKNKASAMAEASIKLAALLLGLCGLRCLGLAGIGLGILPAEALHASGGIHQLLLAGKERVAIRADFQVNSALMR
jgi:hypothetical protein